MLLDLLCAFLHLILLLKKLMYQNIFKKLIIFFLLVQFNSYGQKIDKIVSMKRLFILFIFFFSYTTYSQTAEEYYNIGMQNINNSKFNINKH